LFDTRAFYWDAAGAVTSLGHRFPLHCLAVILAILTKNNPFGEEKHEMTLWPNNFTLLTLFCMCGAFGSGVSPVCVASLRTAPQILAYVARSTLRAIDQPTWQGVWRRFHGRHT
jgi:hypothetical protein